MRENVRRFDVANSNMEYYIGWNQQAIEELKKLQNGNIDKSLSEIIDDMETSNRKFEQLLTKYKEIYTEMDIKTRKV